jgi:hypothetical protein
MLLFQPEPDDADLSPDDTLPPWAFRSLEAPAQGMPETGMMAPAALQRLQARTRLRTHPHLVRRIPGSDPEIHPLDLDVTLIGYGATRVSLGAGKDKTLAGVHKTNSAYRIKAKGLFGRIVINGASKREAVLKSRDRIEIDGVLFEFHPGLEGEGE